MELKDLIKNSLSSEQDDPKDRLRIIQELVPGKQITLAHVIASPDPILYNKLGLNPELDFTGSAIGILTVSPAETAIIAADLATKSASVDLSFVDRFSGTLIITGMISDVESALRVITDYCRNKLGFTVCEISKT
ncbi:MAG TPA: BMC domain-containing protein [Candidatus Ornithomonoglobus merdipullorum]|mgnify:FL=1|uniref:BMC domain-containing protein n=1 Tax=Candidatus Ornithomonoglobus merdipullorum TaxID=2840895 RepID=A0A9D1SF91_9FIRM|nr:BMC domain-containing protein [Candidatus Ornithomonoglobus merdipullorum]